MCSMYSVALDYDYPTARRGSIPNSHDEDEESDEFEEDLGNLFSFLISFHDQLWRMLGLSS